MSDETFKAFDYQHEVTARWLGKGQVLNLRFDNDDEYGEWLESKELEWFITEHSIRPIGDWKSTR